MLVTDGTWGVLDRARIDTLPFVRHVEYRAVMTSTNDVALQRAADPSLLVPALVLAAEQTAGRGRGSNRWWSAPGALTFSLVLEPARVDLASDHWPRLSLTTAMAVCDALTGLAPAADWGAKWPNDVVVNGCKVCGILVEVPNHGARAGRRVVVGVGLNVNNSRDGAPDSLRGVVTALCDVAGRQFDLTDVLARLLAAFAVRLDQLVGGDPRLQRAWTVRCVLRGRYVRIDHGALSVEGECQGIDDNGALVVNTATGTQHIHGGVVVG
ncbi:MAG: biotin--[acetyl-CoA-carboxylase] ligase [Planctomycetes bacterium RBG_16_64_10]|nr:MAG: biotin--[acetyl-CoA-carboxylase] ligase [Planctomycetes bacterium RBG_16_64_10]